MHAHPSRGRGPASARRAAIRRTVAAHAGAFRISEKIDLALERAAQRLGHGPPILVTSAHGGQAEVMVASCALAFDFVPPRPIVVVDARARFPLMESGEFGLPIPTRALAAQTLAVTSQLARASLPESKSFAPMSQGCAAWLKCRAISDASQRFDVILGEVIEACSKAPSYAANRRHLRRDPMDRTSYCVASGQSFGTGAFFRTKTDTN